MVSFLSVTGLFITLSKNRRQLVRSESAKKENARVIRPGALWKAVVAKKKNSTGIFILDNLEAKEDFILSVAGS